MALVTGDVDARAAAATVSLDTDPVRQTDVAAQALAASASVSGVRVAQADVLAAAGLAVTVVQGIMPNMVMAFRIGGDPTIEPVLVTLIDPAGEDYDGLAVSTGGYIRTLPDQSDVVVVADVVIPPLLSLVTEEQSLDEYAAYWLMRRYFALPEIQQAVEPIRVKVAATQDISLLDAEDLRVVRTLNSRYNTDYDLLVYSATSVPSSP